MIWVVLDTAAIILLFLHYSSCQFVIHVDSCPNNEQSWAQRSSTFQCQDTHKVYHCILDSNHTLIETCMRSYNISSSTVGCPKVRIYKNQIYLSNPFYPCDPMHPGCPENNHKKYQTKELYIYPACINSGNVYRGNETETSIIMPFENTGTDPLKDKCTVLTSTQEIHFGSMVVFLTSALLLIMVIPVMYLFFRRRFKSRLEAEMCKSTQIDESTAFPTTPLNTDVKHTPEMVSAQDVEIAISESLEETETTDVFLRKQFQIFVSKVMEKVRKLRPARMKYSSSYSKMQWKTM